MHPILEAEAATVQTMHLKDNREALRQKARRASLSGIYRADKPFAATLEDISRRGLRIRSGASMLCGDTIVIDAPADAGLEPIACRIRRVQIAGTDDQELFEYGIQVMPTSRDQGHRWFLYFCYGGVAKHSVPLV
jgi:hypothetical protein